RGRARDPPHEDGGHVLVLSVPRDGFRPHLSPRRRGSAAGLGHAAAQVPFGRRRGVPGVQPRRGAGDPARVLRRAGPRQGLTQRARAGAVQPPRFLPEHGMVRPTPKETPTQKDARDQQDVQERSSPPALIIYEVVRRAGEEEMERPNASLWWSGFAGGVSIS